MKIPLGLAHHGFDNGCVIQLLETLAAELERPREITAQVVTHLVGTYGLTREQLGEFLLKELPSLEDYEIDLILSPLFTPTLEDQTVFAGLLRCDSVPRTEWPQLVRALAARPTCAALLTEDGRRQVVPLRDVTIERFVYRLRLDGTINAATFARINHVVPAADRPRIMAIARRAIWSKGKCGEILTAWLGATPTKEGYRANDAAQLLKLVETYEPADVAELRSRIPHWLEVLRQEINEASGPKPFFNERVQDMHGGGRDQRRQDHSRIEAKEAERAVLERLQRLLAG